MQFSIQSFIKNKSAFRNITVLTVLFMLASAIFSYFILPVAAAFYAALLMYEGNARRRIHSYIVPIIAIAFDILLKGTLSFDALSCIITGLLIYFLCKKGISKAESVFWISLALVASLLISALIFGLVFGKGMGIVGFYTELYNMYKAEFIELLTSLTLTSEQGTPLFAYNRIEAELLFNELVILLAPALVLLAVFLCALSLRIFSSLIVRYSGDECGIYEWRFNPSNLVAYFYLAVAILTIFAGSGTGIFAHTVTSLNIIFAPVFAYIGASVIHALIVSRGKSSFFALSVIVIACVILYTFSITLLSFIGVYFTVVANKVIKKK